MTRIVITCFFIVQCISSPAETGPTPEMSEAQKIATFCKVWGFLKYYHPIVAKGRSDWDKEFMNRVDSAEKLLSKEELSDFYIAWIKSLGEVSLCKKCNNHIPDSLAFNLELNWLHDTSLFSNHLIQELEFIKRNRNQNRNHYVQQNKLFVGKANYKNEKTYKDSVFPCKEMRLLALARYWNMINYFYPYKYVIGNDWSEVLAEMVPEFKYARDTISYHLAMKELTAKIHDSHAQFSTKYTAAYFGRKFVPFKFRLIGNKAVAIFFWDETKCQKDDIRHGDAFLSVNGERISAIIERQTKYIGASNQATILRNIQYGIFNGEADSMQITFERNGIISEKYIHRYYPKYFNYKVPADDKTQTWKILDSLIGYVNLGLLQRKETKGVLEKLRNTKAIIFDVRNYPNNTMYRIEQFLSHETHPVAKFSIPDIRFPGVYSFRSTSFIANRKMNPYKGLVIMLFNESTQSGAEFTLMGIQAATKTIGIGSQTAGADGNVSLIIFPGNYRTYVSGIGVYYPDGRETQRIGIIPDIEIQPTVEGIRSGKDELLEKAIEVINRK